MHPSSHQNDNLYLRIIPSTYSPQQPNTIPQDLVFRHSPLAATNHLLSNSSTTNSRSMETGQKNVGDDHTKRVMHRDIERQRRQEMATLCTSLRNLLPLQYIKGKRSTSDHMHEAAKYIKDLEKKIKELGMKRDELKNSIPNSRTEHGESSSKQAPICVQVRSTFGGVEVVIGCDYGDQEFKLSRVLRVLHKEGLDVVSCNSAKVNQRLIYTIQSQVIDLAGLDIFKLENTLTEEIISSND